MDDFVQSTGIKRMGDWGGVVQYGTDNSMVVMFYLKPVHQPGKSVQQGRQIYEDQLYVRIHPPGERLNIIDRAATDADKRRFPIQWHQYQENAPQVSEGTPVEMLFPAQPSIPAALRANGVYTIEHLSELSAHAIETIGMGAQQWCNEAVKYLEVANKGVKASQMKAALEEKDRELHSMKHKMDLMQAELDRLREMSASTVTMDQVQQLLANNGGNRGVYAPGKLGKQFDAQTAQINATRRDTMPKAKAKQPDKASPRKRTRARLED
jgi:hypothetical protein